VRKKSLISLSRIAAASALLVFAGWVAQPAMAQGAAQQRGASAGGNRGDIGANAKGIKDSKIKPCGNCGLTGGRVKRNDGGKPAARNKGKFKAGADLDGRLR
jgi:hypothetical protein